MTATLAHALRLAEALDQTGPDYQVIRPLITVLRELAATTAAEILTVQSVTEQARMRGIVAGADK